MAVTHRMTVEGLQQAAHEGLVDGKPELAVRLLEQALQHRPDDAAIWNNLATALLAAGRTMDAATMARKAIKLHPDHAMAHFNLGRALSLSGEWSGAAEALERAAQLAPNPQAVVGLAAMRLKQGEVAKAIEALEIGARRFPELAAGLESHVLFARHFDPATSPEDLFAAPRAWAARHAPAIAPRPPRVARERIRVGYVSPTIGRSSMAFALWPLWRHHDRAHFEVYAYSGAPEADATTAAFHKTADAWRDTAALDDDAFENLVRDDAIDVLVDLAGHTPEGRLGVFARRPAPVQVSWLDYFDTTGLAAIDAVVADERSAASEAARRLFVERVLSAGPVRYPYEPPAYAPAVGPLPSFSGRPVTFGSFARWAKATPDVRRAWRDILSGAPGTRLVIKADAFSDAKVRARVAGEFAAAGIDAGRVELRPESPHIRMLGELNDVDVVLDTFPYNGGITTLEALWMGRPVLTCSGETLISRQGESILAALGLDELVAPDDAGYVARAVALAREPDRIAALAGGLRERMASSPLTDGAAFARRMEALYRQLLDETTA